MGVVIGGFHFQGSPQPHAPASWISSDARCWLGGTPITSHSGRFTLVFKGQIYNHQQVRRGLRFQDWRGTSDSETLVEGLAQRGPALLLELRGMFAFAAYDSQKQQLLVARDRLGIKPLYLSWQPQGVLFASERRSLPKGHRLSLQTISQVLAFGHDCTPAELLVPGTQGIVSLPPGMVVRINHSRRHDPVRYWPQQPRPDWTPLPIRDGHRARTFVRQRLEEVVAQHLAADRPVACLLSSGLDSAILAALACRQQPGEISTFTIVMPGSPGEDQTASRQMARHCGSQHHELAIDETDALAWVEQALVALDGPTVGGINTYLISRALADQGIKVALSGLGADELFGGCTAHRLMPCLALLRWLPEQIRHHLLQALIPRYAHKLSRLPRWDRWHLGLALHRSTGDRDLVAARAEPLHWPASPPQRLTQAWGQTSWAELFGTFEPMLLRHSDAMSMASGLELRLPFLDHQLVELALRMPQRFQRHGKGLLRLACADLLPIGILDRRKQGCSLPMAAWMRGPLRDLCLSRLEALNTSGLINPLWVRKQWQVFETGQLHWPKAWSLVVLGEFAHRELLP
jgi:asparagine synthase (glutamine-hydrolysing)